MVKAIKSDIFTFGRELITSRDLDPVYVLLWEAKFDRPLLLKYLLAYFCYYHIGTAAWIVDQKDYWKAMMTAAKSKEYPRASERRHFRGQNAIKSVDFLQERGVQNLFDPLLDKSLSVEQVMDKVQEWVAYGPWISFKVADVLERLSLCKVKFDKGAMFLFDSPRDATELMFSKLNQGNGQYGGDVTEYCVQLLIDEFKDLKSPPRYERKINAQEAETVLCKWGSYMNDHYWVGKDIEECKHALDWKKGETVERLQAAGIRGDLW